VVEPLGARVMKEMAEGCSGFFVFIDGSEARFSVYVVRVSVYGRGDGTVSFIPAGEVFACGR